MLVIIKEQEINMLMTENSLYKVYDARGNGDGNISCTITGGHQTSISDYTSIILRGGVHNGLDC